MSKEKYILSGIVVAGLVVSMGISMYVFNNPKETTRTAASGGNPITVPQTQSEVRGDLVFEDAAGFRFRYPSSVTVKDVTPEGTEFYTILTLSKGSELMSIEIKDTSFTSIEVWKSENASKATLTGALSIDGIAASQYESTKFYTVAIDQGVLYVFESPSTEYWKRVQDVIAASFDFQTSGGASQSAGTKPSSAGGGVIYEEEEVIE